MRTCIVPLLLGLTAVTALARIDVAPGANTTKDPSRANLAFVRRLLIVDDENRLDLDLDLLQPVAGAVDEDNKPRTTSTTPTTTYTTTSSRKKHPKPKATHKSHAKSPSKAHKPHTPKSRSEKPHKPTPPSTTSPIPNDRQPPGNSYHRPRPTTEPHDTDPTSSPTPVPTTETTPSPPPSHSPEPTPEHTPSPNPSSVTTSSEVSPVSVTPSPTSDAPTVSDPPRTTEAPEPTTSPVANPTGNGGDIGHKDPTTTTSRTTPTSSDLTPVVNSPTTTVPAPTTVIVPTTTTMTTTTTTSGPVVTSSPSTSHHSRPTTTTTPWLPSSIEPIAPPKTTSTLQPGTSLPDVVIPNQNPVIPPGSFHVHLRFERVSYYQVINNGVLAAQLVSFIPAQLAQVLNIDSHLVMVLAIRDGSAVSGNNKKRSLQRRDVVSTDNVQDAILMTVTVPQSQYYTLQGLVENKVSALYIPGPNTFGQFLDPTYPLSNQPPSRSGSGNGSNGDDNSDDGGSDDVTADPLTGNLPNPVGTTAGPHSSRGPIIGSIVGLATVAYVGIALVVMRAYRRKKLREQEEQAKREAFQQSISAPVMHGQGWGWHSS